MNFCVRYFTTYTPFAFAHAMPRHLDLDDVLDAWLEGSDWWGAKMTMEQCAHYFGSLHAQFSCPWFLPSTYLIRLMLLSFVMNLFEHHRGLIILAKLSAQNLSHILFWRSGWGWCLSMRSSKLVLSFVDTEATIWCLVTFLWFWVRSFRVLTAKAATFRRACTLASPRSGPCRLGQQLPWNDGLSISIAWLRAWFILKGGCQWNVESQNGLWMPLDPYGFFLEDSLCFSCGSSSCYGATTITWQRNSIPHCLVSILKIWMKYHNCTTDHLVQLACCVQLMKQWMDLAAVSGFLSDLRLATSYCTYGVLF